MTRIAQAATEPPELNNSDIPVFAFPTSFAQQRLWFLDQLLPESPAYKLNIEIRFRGPVNLEALHWSLNEIVRRHESLRTVFATVSGQPVQVVQPAVGIKIFAHSFEAESRAKPQQIIRRFARSQIRPRFDLSKGPLIRATLLDFGAVEHVLLMALHHIITDAWSMMVLERELRTLYNARRCGQPSPLPDLKLQYADYTVWQRTWLQSQVFAPQLAYWKEQLAGAPHLVELATDRQRPPVQTLRGERQSLPLPNALVDAIKAITHEHQVTLFTVLLTAFAVLLYRYSDQEDLVVGTPVANRTRTEVEDLIGFFVNTLVLRISVSGNPTFKELLQRVRDVTLGAYANQDLPFDRLVEEFAPERHLSHTPLFQIMFVLQNANVFRKTNRRASSSASSKRGGVDVENSTAKFDLRLSVSESPDRLVASVTYNVDLWNAATVSRMLGHWRNILEAVIADPSQHVSALPVLSAAEWRQLLEWNETHREFGRECCLHEWFEATAERSPDNVAVVFEDQQVSFGELNQRANQLARYLQKRGVGPEIPVGIYLGRSLDLIVAVLAVLKSGGGYVPLDPTYPKERLLVLIQDAGIPVLISQGRFRERLPECPCDVIQLDCDWAEIANEDRHNVRSAVMPHNLAYIIYTSGSTGLPKGVLVEHRQVLNYCKGVMERLFLNECATYAMVQPLSVDSCVTVIFPSLATGACLHIISTERAGDPHALRDYFSRYQIDCLKIAPSHLAALQSADRPEQLMPRRRLIIGGEASRWDWVCKLQALAPNCRIFNHYGPTETTVGVLTYPVRVENTTPVECLNTPLGRPLPNTRAYVLDRNLQPVPIGVRGELYIGGLSVARGYLNRLELTSEKFIQDPFNENGSGRLYKTGDLVRYLPTGDIEFFGRIDSQVKIRGFRVEPGEIEATLHLHPQIREAVVIVNGNVPDQDRLVAYIVPRGLPMPAISDVRDFLRQRLPQYMVPSAFVLLSSLPRTLHGKLDRRALPPPETSRPELKETFVAPQGSVEEALANIWTKILGIPEIGVNDNFFDLGGHSLMATQLISRLRDNFQVELPLRSLFESPTVAALAEVIRKAKNSGPSMSIPTILPVARELYQTTLTAAGVLRAPERLKNMLLA